MQIFGMVVKQYQLNNNKNKKQMSKLSKKISKDYQPYRAVFNFLSGLESKVKYKKKGVKNPKILLDLFIEAAKDLKSRKRDKNGNQSFD